MRLVGKGNKTNLWDECWIWEETLKEKFPGLCRISSQQMQKWGEMGYGKKEN